MTSRLVKTKTALFTALTLGASSLLCSCGSDSTSSTVFEVIIENMSSQSYISALTSGVFLVHRADSPVFTLGQALSDNGFEAFAEDGNPNDIIDTLSFTDNISLTGIVDSSRNGNQGILLPGGNFRFVIAAEDKDSKLSAYFKFLESNDVFLGTSPAGIPLFNAAGAAISGDITSSFTFFDAGTEVNEQPGQGANQPARQGADNTGATEGGVVRPVNDGFSYPAASSFRVTINVLDEVES